MNKQPGHTHFARVCSAGWAAIAGVGFIGPVHLRAANLANAEIVGIAGSDPARARAAAASLDVARVCNRWGIWGKSLERDNPWDVGWWRYRVPGLGEVDWVRLIDTLYEGGFDGVLSVEHEDPVWGGTEDKIQIGLEIAERTLRPLLVR
jgi:sugar phosphate isomerase/epimerase